MPNGGTDDGTLQLPQENSIKWGLLLYRERKVLFL